MDKGQPRALDWSFLYVVFFTPIIWAQVGVHQTMKPQEDYYSTSRIALSCFLCL